MYDEFEELRLRDLHFLTRLAEHGSITATARELGMPKATASRRLARIEEHAGVSLVKRSTRRMAWTEAGEELLRRSRTILTIAREASRAIREEAPGGTLRVSVPIPLGRMLAGSIIARFREQLPGVRLEVLLQNERIDLIEEGVDVAIRGGALRDSEYLTRRLTGVSMWLYAGGRWSGVDLEEVPLIGSSGDPRLLARAGLQVGRTVALIDDRTAVADALSWGSGAGLLPAFLGESRRPGPEKLVRLRPQEIVTLPVHALYHTSSREDRRVHTLLDQIEEHLENLL